MTQKITIASYGFFLYPTSGGKCERFAAPSLTKGPHTHKCIMLIEGNVKKWSINGSQTPADELELRACTVSVGPPAGADLVDFDLIVPFGAICCGARLKSDWHTDDPKDTDVQVELSRGSLTAYPDNYTNNVGWAWRDCNGVDVERQFSSLVVYEQNSWTGAIEITARGKHGTSGSIEFEGDVALGIVYFPEVPPDSEEAHKALDKAHAKATKALCSDAGDDPIFPTPKHGQPRYSRDPNLSSGMKTFLRLAEAAPMQAIESAITTKGRPNCGARQMAL